MRLVGLIRQCLATGKSLLSGTSGAMTILAIVLFVVLVGVGGLAIDLGRLYGVHGQMQAFVDNAALAGAQELDGQSTSITRAIRATIGDGNAGPLITGKQNFAVGATDLSIGKVTLLSALGADPGPTAATPAAGDVVVCTYEDGAYNPADCNTSLNAYYNAKYIEVVATEREVDFYILPIVDLIRGLFGSAPIADSTNIKLRATAGFVRQACNNPPLMICNPNETAGNDEPFNMARGRMIFVHDYSNAPGNFGLLEYTGTGASVLRDEMGLVNPNTTCHGDNAPVKKGENTGPVQQGMNVRFDMFDGPMGGSKNDPNYAPAFNVIKGLTMNPSNCKTSLVTPSTNPNGTMPLPRDNCFMNAVPAGAGTAGTGCTFYGTDKIFGDGNWARDAYWALNHPGQAQPTGYSTMSRYDVYRYEIATQAIPTSKSEKQGPTCSNQKIDNPDRRVLYLGVVNCLAHPPASTAQIRTYAKVFLTEPVGNTDWSGRAAGTSPNNLTFGAVTSKSVSLEMIEVVTPDDPNPVLHEFPVLYR